MKTLLTMLRQSHAAALILALGCGAASQAHADDRSIWRWPGDDGSHSVATGNLVDVQIHVAGQSAPLFYRPGRWDRHYFQAFKGRNYSVVLRNKTGRRIGVLVAVDGLNVVNGEQSSLAHDEPMYVLGPYEQATIRGWRTSLQEVRRFVFVDEERSYAERTDQANEDMGWIRVLSFREVQPFGWWSNPRVRDGRPESELNQRPDRTGEAQPAPEALGDRRAQERNGSESFKSAPESNPGTGWGDRRSDPVQRTRFLAEANAYDHVVLRYEYASGLRALGIFPRRLRTWDREDGRLGFSQPPRR